MGRFGPILVPSSDRTRVTRLFFAERTVILKEPLGPDSARRRQHEAGDPGAAAQCGGRRAAGGGAAIPRLHRAGGRGATSLAELAKPLAVDRLVAVGGADSGGGGDARPRGDAPRHRAGEHRGLPGGAPCLVDFARATSLAEIRPEFTHQTRSWDVGVSGAGADRADRSAGGSARRSVRLGCDALRAGDRRAAFGSGDPLRLIHDHLARVPIAPAKVNPAVPGQLSEIIMHLLEKEPDNRYRTAEGVVYDLERLRDPHAAAALRVGEHDVPLRLLPPSRLVGARTRSRRCGRRSRRRWRAGVGGCWSAARRGRVRRRWSTSCDRW